jgi:hypothetical protein
MLSQMPHRQSNAVDRDTIWTLCVEAPRDFETKCFALPSSETLVIAREVRDMVPLQGLIRMWRFGICGRRTKIRQEAAFAGAASRQRAAAWPSDGTSTATATGFEIISK